MTYNKNNLKNMLQSVVGGILVALLIIATIIVIYKPWSNSLHVPITYCGGDDMSIMAEIKAMGTEGSVVDCTKQGVPFDAQKQTVSSYYLFNDIHYVGGILYKLTGEIGLATNLTLFVFMLLNGLCAYISLKCMKVRIEFSVLASWAYGTLYYVFYRNVGHLMLSAYYCAPLTILLCYWILVDDEFFRYGKYFFRNRRNIAAIIIALLIANNGIGYYPFFSCFFIIVAGLYSWLSKGYFKSFLSSCAVILHIVGAVVLVLLPYFNSVSKYGNPVEIEKHPVLQGELYALKITRLFFPIKETGIARLDELFSFYANDALLQTETSEYIGILAIIGFVVLIGVLMSAGRIKDKALNMMPVLLLAGICLSVMGGLGMIFNLLVFGMVRCYNRISVYLAFICLAGLGLFVTNMVTRVKVFRIVYYILLVPLTVISIYYQIPEKVIQTNDNYNYEIDKNFIAKIESTAEENSMIFQLPYHSYPAGDNLNDMSQDRPFVGYLFSKNLSWSYGAYNTGKSDRWNKTVAAYDTKYMVDTVVYMGFKGIFIEEEAYTQEELSTLKEELTLLLGKEPMESDNKIMMYYDLSDYYDMLKSSQTETQWNDNVDRVKSIAD